MRPGRLVTPALLILCSLLATACGAGQVAQTATQKITQEGANAERGGIAVRGVIVPTPPLGSYKTGERAPLYLAISAEESVSDTLVAVTSEAAASVALVSSPLGASGSAAPTSARPSVAGSPSATPAVSPSSTPSATPTTSPSASPSGLSDGLQIGSGALVFLGEGMTHLELTGLTEDLVAGDTLSVTFTFARAGDITLDVPVATPDTPGPRLKPSADHE